MQETGGDPHEVLAGTLLNDREFDPFFWQNCFCQASDGMESEASDSGSFAEVLH